MATSNVSTTQSAAETLDLRRLFRSVVKLKWVYLASFIFFMALAATYCVIKFPQYEIKSAILIEDPSGDGGFSGAGGMATMMRTFSVGGFGGSSVNNELVLINSHDVLMNTAKTLGLNRNYILRDGLTKEMLFLNSPILVEGSQEMMDTLTKAMKVVVDIDGERADITVKRGMLGHVIGEAENVTLPATVQTIFGPIMVVKTDDYTGEPQRIEVAFGSYSAAADYLYDEIAVDTPDKLADAIEFQLLYPNKERGMAILNTLMAEYNLKRLNRKHSTAQTQLEFLNERIDKLFGELSAAEKEIEDFKANNKIVDIASEAPILLESSITSRTEMVKAQAEVAYYREVLAALANPERGDELLPVFDSNAYPMIKDYNDLIIAKRELERSAKPGNPVLVQAEENISQMRTSVTRNVESMLQSAQALLESQAALVAKSDSRLNSLPAAERDYINLERDRRMKSELYAFLVSQRENAMLQIYNDETLGFIVDEAYTAIKPSKKKAILAIGGCLFLAILCPSMLALWLTIRHRRVTDLMDLAPSGLEKNAVRLDGTKATTNELRTRLMERGNGLKIFVGGESAGEVIRDLSASYSAIDRRTATINPADINLPADNDSLLLPAFARKIADALEQQQLDAVLTEVPNPERVTELAPLLTADSDAILILAYAPGEAQIKDINRIARALPAGSIIFALTPQR